MQGQYAHGVAYYRCRFPQEYALANRIEHPRNVYLREDVVIEPVDTWLAQLFDPIRRDDTISALAAVQQDEIPPGVLRAKAVLAECDTKLARYRAALEAGSDPTVVTGWIAQVQAERAVAEAEIAAQPASARKLTPTQIGELVTGITGAIALLRRADPADKAEVYRQLGLRLTYQPETQTVDVQAQIGRPPWGNGLCRRGDLNPHALYGH
jgi:site-specific DNA recombinase